MNVKQIILIILITTSIVDFCQAQENTLHYSAKSGVGYFSNIFGIFDDVGAQKGSEPGQPGNMLWMEYQVHINSKTTIGFFTGSGRTSFTYYFDEPFMPSRVTENYWQFNLNFYRYFYFEHSVFSFGIGPSFFAVKMPTISYKMQHIKEGDEYYYNYYNIGIEMDKDAVFGLNIDFNYEFCINDYLGLGIKFNGLVTMFYGAESFLVSPYLRFSF